ncbi:hypothetical protein ABW04_27310 [Priestia megaterium]|nr:hypothetical protein ABW04_27310 [Priestia megaterium]
MYTFRIEKNAEPLGCTLRADVEKITVDQPWMERMVKLFLDNRGVQKKDILIKSVTSKDGKWRMLF